MRTFAAIHLTNDDNLATNGKLATPCRHCQPSCDLHSESDLDIDCCCDYSQVSSKENLGETLDTTVCSLCSSPEENSVKAVKGNDKAKQIKEEDLCVTGECEKLFKNEWPLVCDSNVIVNFANISWDSIRSGDFYFYVKKGECPSDKIGLWVKFCVGCIQSEVQIPVSKFGGIFKMEFKSEILLEKTDTLGDSLHHCLACLEDSINKLRWQDVVPRTGQFNHSNVHLKQSNVRTNGINGSCAEKVKQFKNQQNNCFKCEKLSDKLSNWSYDRHSQNRGYYSKESQKNDQKSPGKCGNAFFLNFEIN